MMNVKNVLIVAALLFFVMWVGGLLYGFVESFAPTVFVGYVATGAFYAITAIVFIYVHRFLKRKGYVAD